MPFDSHKSFDDLVNSEQLDSLLDAARKQIQKNAALAGYDPEVELETFDEEVEEAKRAGAAAVEAIDGELEATKVSAAQKVAVVDLLVSTVAGLI